MGYMTIDGRKVEFTDEPNVLSVIRNADIDIPTLCYHSELSVYGACRLCTVEDERGKTFASCSEPPRDGMVIYTNTPRLMKYRKMILELLLAAHCRDCTTCIKSGECQLQALAHRMGVTTVRFENTKEQYPLDFSSPSISGPFFSLALSFVLLLSVFFVSVVFFFVCPHPVSAAVPSSTVLKRMHPRRIVLFFIFYLCIQKRIYLVFCRRICTVCLRENCLVNLTPLCFCIILFLIC